MKDHCSPLLPLLHDEPIVDDNAKAEVFNHYFNSVFTNENMANFSMVKSSVDHLPPMLEAISFSPDAVYQELIHLNVSKACGPDLLPPLILKKAADFICSPLSSLFNQSMSSGHLPRDWVSFLFIRREIKDLLATTDPLAILQLLLKLWNGLYTII